jgi:hypothetical protein
LTRRRMTEKGAIWAKIEGKLLDFPWNRAFRSSSCVITVNRRRRLQPQEQAYCTFL